MTKYEALQKKHCKGSLIYVVIIKLNYIYIYITYKQRSQQFIVMTIIIILSIVFR